MSQPNRRTTAQVAHSHLWGERPKKYDWLNAHEVADTHWTDLEPETPSYWFVPRDTSLEEEYRCGWKVTDTMPINGVGITTARDHVVIDLDEGPIVQRAQLFRDSTDSDAQLCQQFRMPMKKGWNISRARTLIQEEKELSKHIRPITYRPFDNRLIFFHDSLVWRTVKRITGHMLAGRNAGMCFHRRMEIQGEYAHFFCSQYPVEHCAVSIKTTDYLAPLYLYPDPNKPDREVDRSSAIADYRDLIGRVAAANDWDTRRVVARIEAIFRDLFPAESYPRWPNFDPFFLDDIRKRTGFAFLPDGRGDLRKTFGPEDVFAYIYGVFHSPRYRTRYAEFLKIDFPRVPLTSSADLFRALCGKGQELVDLHLMRDERLSNASFWGTSYPVAGKHDVTAIDYSPPGESRKSNAPQSPIERGRVYINKSQPKKGLEAQYFDGVPPEVWEFRIGGYQVLHHWLKERKRHKRSLTLDDIEHFQKVVAVLRETIRLTQEIDATIDAHGGWPIA